jgi:hypothetical protein
MNDDMDHDHAPKKLGPLGVRGAATASADQSSNDKRKTGSRTNWMHVYWVVILAGILGIGSLAAAGEREPPAIATPAAAATPAPTLSADGLRTQQVCLRNVIPGDPEVPDREGYCLDLAWTLDPANPESEALDSAAPACWDVLSRSEARSRCTSSPPLNLR